MNAELKGAIQFADAANSRQVKAMFDKYKAELSVFRGADPVLLCDSYIQIGTWAKVVWLYFEIFELEGHDSCIHSVVLFNGIDFACLLTSLMCQWKLSIFSTHLLVKDTFARFYPQYHLVSAAFELA